MTLEYQAGLSARMVELEVSMSAFSEKLSSTSEILSRMQNTLEHQTELMSKVLVIQEKQGLYKDSFDKLVSTVGEMSLKHTKLELEHGSLHNWVKGAIWAGGGLVLILAFTINQNLGRITKIESDFYIPTLRVSPQAP